MGSYLSIALSVHCTLFPVASHFFPLGAKLFDVLSEMCYDFFDEPFHLAARAEVIGGCHQVVSSPNWNQVRKELWDEVWAVIANSLCHITIRDDPILNKRSRSAGQCYCSDLWGPHQHLVLVFHVNYVLIAGFHNRKWTLSVQFQLIEQPIGWKQMYLNLMTGSGTLHCGRCAVSRCGVLVFGCMMAVILASQFTMNYFLPCAQQRQYTAQNVVCASVVTCVRPSVVTHLLVNPVLSRVCYYEMNRQVQACLENWLLHYSCMQYAFACSVTNALVLSRFFHQFNLTPSKNFCWDGFCSVRSIVGAITMANFTIRLGRVSFLLVLCSPQQRFPVVERQLVNSSCRRSG